MEMTTEIEKSLAIMQELDYLEWFTTGTGDDVRIWEGDEDDQRSEYIEYCDECTEYETLVDTFESWLEENGTEVHVDEYDENGDWKVYTDDEADDAWEESLDNYLDECVLPDLPGTLQNYFDRNAWKSDARMDGRGHSLSGYDGHECEQVVNNTTYYLYRQN